MKQLNKSFPKTALFIMALYVSIGLLLPNVVSAASSEEINIGVDATLKRFSNEVTGGSEFLKKSRRCFGLSKSYQSRFWYWWGIWRRCAAN